MVDKQRKLLPGLSARAWWWVHYAAAVMALSAALVMVILLMTGQERQSSLATGVINIAIFSLIVEIVAVVLAEQKSKKESLAGYRTIRRAFEELPLLRRSTGEVILEPQDVAVSNSGGDGSTAEIKFFYKSDAQRKLRTYRVLIISLLLMFSIYLFSNREQIIDFYVYNQYNLALSIPLAVIPALCFVGFVLIPMYRACSTIPEKRRALLRERFPNVLVENVASTMQSRAGLQRISLHQTAKLLPRNVPWNMTMIVLDQKIVFYAGRPSGPKQVFEIPWEAVKDLSSGSGTFAFLPVAALVFDLIVQGERFTLPIVINGEKMGLYSGDIKHGADLENYARNLFQNRGF